MTRPPSLVVRVVAQAAWRRRYHLLIPTVAMLVAGVAAAKFLPQNYQATSLMLLQEGTKTNPFDRDTSSEPHDRMRERLAGLEALLKSEKVLGRALSEIGGAQPMTVRQRAAELDILRKALSLDLLGNDFLEFKLKGRARYGLGQQLETITSTFLEALLPDQDEISAAQIILAKRKAEFLAANQAVEALKIALQTMAPADGASVGQRSAALADQITQTSGSLADIEAQLTRVENGMLREEPPGKPLRAQTALEHQVGSSQANLQAERAASYEKARDLEKQRDRQAQDLDDLRTQQTDLQTSVDQYHAKQADIARAETTLADARNGYSEYARRFATLNAKRGISILNAPEKIMIIDAPKDPNGPTIPSLMYVVGGLLSGLAMGVLLALIAEMLDTRIRHAHQVVEATGLPVLAVLPKSGGSLTLGNSGRSGGAARLMFILVFATVLTIAFFRASLTSWRPGDPTQSAATYSGESAP